MSTKRKEGESQKPKEDKYKRKAKSIKSSLNRYGVKHALTVAEIEKMLHTGIVCPYCHEKLTPRFVSVDHIQPRSKGGKDENDNIHFVCSGCNLAKGNLTDAQFINLLHFLSCDEDMKRNVLIRLKAGGARVYGNWTK